MTSIFSAMVFLVFFLALGIILLQLIRGAGQWNRNNHAPRLTVSAVVVSAPIVKMLGASGKIEPSRTVTLVSEVVRAPASVVSGVFGCAGYIVFNSAIV